MPCSTPASAGSARRRRSRSRSRRRSTRARSCSSARPADCSSTARARSPASWRRSRAAGGAQRQYLNHWHESLWGFAPPELHSRLIVHAADAAEVERRGGEPATFDRPFHLEDDFAAIPIPGHTPGATAYLWASGDHRVLFTGDSLYLSGERWRAAVLDSSDRARYVESLELIRELDFDVLVPWASSAGGPFVAHVTADERRARLDEVIARVRAGADA